MFLIMHVVCHLAAASLEIMCWKSKCSKSLQVTLAGLHCAQLLAEAKLVHRDLDLANFFWDKNGHFVADLELAAEAPLQVPLQLCLLMRPQLQLKLFCMCIAGDEQRCASIKGLDISYTEGRRQLHY